MPPRVPFPKDMKFVISVPVKDTILSETAQDLRKVIQEMRIEVGISGLANTYKILHPSSDVENAYMEIIPLDDEPEIHSYEQKNKRRETERLHAIFFISKEDDLEEVLKKALKTIRYISLSDVFEATYVNMYEQQPNQWFYIK